MFIGFIQQGSGCQTSKKWFYGKVFFLYFCVVSKYERNTCCYLFIAALIFGIFGIIFGCLLVSTFRNVEHRFLLLLLNTLNKYLLHFLISQDGDIAFVVHLKINWKRWKKQIRYLLVWQKVLNAREFYKFKICRVYDK